MEGPLPGTGEPAGETPPKEPKQRFLILMPAKDQTGATVYLEAPVQPPEGMRSLNAALDWMVCHPELSGKFKVVVDLGIADIVV